MKSFSRFFASTALCLSLVPLTVQGQDHLGEVRFSQDSLQATLSQRLPLESYQLDSATGTFTKTGNTWVTTMVNHLSADAKIQVVADQDNIWVYLQYFTDIDGDGKYEWLADSDGFPLWDSLATTGRIYPYGVVASSFAKGDTVNFSVSDLFHLGLEAEKDRSSQGTSSLEGKEYSQSGDLILCITLADSNYLLQNQLDLLPSYYFTLDIIGSSHRDLLGAYVFADVTPFDWQFEAVDFVAKHGIFNGITPDTFSVGETLNRGMVLQSLYGFMGKPAVTGGAFEDVNPVDWYYKAVSWAASIGVLEDTMVRPESNITREEILYFLYRFAEQSPYYQESLKNTEDFSSYADGDMISEIYAEAFSWGLANGIISGDTDNRLNPQGEANRGEASFLMKNFAQIQVGQEAETEGIPEQELAELLVYQSEENELQKELLALNALEEASLLEEKKLESQQRVTQTQIVNYRKALAVILEEREELQQEIAEVEKRLEEVQGKIEALFSVEPEEE
ncbi:MAG: S-layer homology domain-containing protein [Eubacteriales bacterium]